MIVTILILLIVVCIPAWCRRRNVGIMTWAFRMIPLLAILNPLIGCRFFGFAWMMGLALFSLIRVSLLLAGALLLLLLVICGMIVFWPGWRLKMPGKRWLRGILWGAYACFSILMAAGFALLTTAAVSAMWMSWQFRVIDCRYATQGEMDGGGFRPRAFARWLPPGAKDIHYRSEAKFGQVEERLTCYCDEADLVRYAAAGDEFVRDAGLPYPGAGKPAACGGTDGKRRRNAAAACFRREAAACAVHIIDSKSCV